MLKLLTICSGPSGPLLGTRSWQSVIIYHRCRDSSAIRFQMTDYISPDVRPRSAATTMVTLSGISDEARANGLIPRVHKMRRENLVREGFLRNSFDVI